MTPSEIQKRARAAIREAKQSRRPGAGTGPTSAEGKAISAMNALKHGLSASLTVMPGESAEERERRIVEDFVAFRVTNEPLAELSALVTDDIEKIKRAERIERALVLGRIEELMAQTEVNERANRTAQALKVLGGACQHLVRNPIPTQRGTELETRIEAMQAAINLVQNIVDGAPMDVVAACHGHLTALADATSHPDVPVASFAALVGSAQQLFDWLVQRARHDEAAQEDLRKAASRVALPSEAELKKLARYTKMIEESLTRRLAALEQLRKTTENVNPATEEQAKAFRLRLRVVT